MPIPDNKPEHYTVDDWNSFLAQAPKGIEKHIAVSTGTGAHEFEKSAKILNANRQLRFICTDVANGYSDHFVAYIKQTLRKFQNKAIIAGHDENGGDLIEKQDKKVKQFYGMSSKTAMDKHTGGVADYSACEGKTGEVPYRGQFENTIPDILGCIRSTRTYVRASQLKELTKRRTFIRVAEQENLIYENNVYVCAAV
jgi:hypothetical protein